MSQANWFGEPIEALNKAGVAYVLVGGLATVAHGYVRLTQDVDIVVGLDEDNARAAIQALTALGYAPRVPVPAEAFALADQRASWARDKHMIVFSLVHPQPQRPVVDLFINYPLDWSRLRSNAMPLPVAGVEAIVCGLGDLIAIKTEAGRPKDLLDVQQLQARRASRDEGDDR